MSTIVMAVCWPLVMPPCQKAVLISLADNSNDEGHCWPSVRYMCTRTCLGRTAVITAIAQLENAGLLQVDRSNGRHSRYILLPGRLPVREPNRFGRRTGPSGEPHQSAWRTGPVRQADTNYQEPSITITTTNGEVEWGLPLTFIEGLLKQAPRAVVVAIEKAQFEPDLRRHVLLEIIARIQAQSTRSPVGLAHALIERAQRGEFKLSAGITLENGIQQRIRSAAKAIHKREDEAAAEAKRNDPAAQARCREALEAACRALGKPIPG